MEYRDFLRSKRERSRPTGFEPGQINAMLFDWQRDIVRWACRRGRACIFADCGLGKTAMQLEWARQCVERAGRSALVVAPLTVGHQTVLEAEKFGMSAKYVRSGAAVSEPSIYVTNYEMVGHFDISDFTAVVLDESSIIKAHDSKTRTELTERLRETPYVLCCTAPPAPNDQMELGTHAEIVGAMKREEMLAMFFTHDGGDTSRWRLKHHAAADFYRWMATWAVMISRPGDIGYPDDGYELPELNIRTHTGDSGYVPDGALFALPEEGLAGQRRARKAGLAWKVESIASMVNASSEQWCVWCDYNDESAALAKAIPDSVEVRGSDSPEKKSDAMLGFADGRYRVIVSKPSICGFGMNWQQCHLMAFCGLSYSYEQFYQAVRRCWRFGQENPVEAHVFTTVQESSSVNAINRKEEQMRETKRGMIAAMAEETERQIAGDADADVPDAAYADAEGKGWQMLLGDSVERLGEFPDSMFGLSVFSPPFASLYTYSDSERDMGNCKDDAEFWEQFKFLIDELYRVLMPGRSCCIHCMNLPKSKQRDGVIGLKDFRGGRHPRVRARRVRLPLGGDHMEEPRDRHAAHQGAGAAAQDHPQGLVHEPPGRA